ncbi:hypothetical protein Ctob_012881, partial [Chrysochromulina tobinii]
MTAEPIGPDLGSYGAAKWRGGVLGANGHIYFVPCCANRILRLDPATNAAEPVGPDLGAYGDAYKWDGGVLGANGHIYFVPCDAKRILRFDPATNAAEPVGPDLGAYNGVSKWCGGVLGANGHIYFVPYDANRIVRVDPATDVAVPVGPDLGAYGAAKWRGGVLGADGRIYFVPCCAKRILRLDPATNAAEPVGPDLGAYGDYKWCGGVLGADGHIYFVPCYAKRILRFDPATNAAEPVGPDLGAYGDAKWSSGVLGADGHIYFVPYDAKRILRFDPATNAAEPVGPDLGAYNGSGMFGAHKWRGGVLGANGHIYFVPKNANRILHLAVPEEQGPPSSSPPPSKRRHTGWTPGRNAENLRRFMAAMDEAAENGVPSDEEPDPEDRGVSPAPAGYSLYGLAADEWAPTGMELIHGLELIHGFRSRPAVSLAESPCEELPAPREELPARPKTARGGPGSDPFGYMSPPRAAPVSGATTERWVRDDADEVLTTAAAAARAQADDPIPAPPEDVKEEDAAEDEFDDLAEIDDDIPLPDSSPSRSAVYSVHAYVERARAMPSSSSALADALSTADAQLQQQLDLIPTSPELEAIIARAPYRGDGLDARREGELR